MFPHISKLNRNSTNIENQQERHKCKLGMTKTEMGSLLYNKLSQPSEKVISGHSSPQPALVLATRNSQKLKHIYYCENHHSDGILY